MIGPKEPLVSVLVPVWNVEKYIERCARSIFEQTYENLEIIFVDDYTPDNSIQIIERILLEYPQRVKQTQIIHHEHNRGLSAARNTAVDACNGEFVFHVDSDDWVELNAVELLLKKQQETDADIVTGCAYRHFIDKVRKINVDGVNLNRRDTLFALIERKISVSIWKRLIRTSLYKDNNIRCIEGVNLEEDFQVVVPLFYYSCSVTGITDFIYHYNRLNVNSYVSNFPHDLSLQYQRIQSRMSVVDFFNDKESVFRQAIEKRKIKDYYSDMLMAFNNKNKITYNKMLYLIKEDKHNWAEIGWDSRWKKTIDSNYYLLKICYPIRVIITLMKYQTFSYILNRILFRIRMKGMFLLTKAKKMRDSK